MEFDKEFHIETYVNPCQIHGNPFENQSRASYSIVQQCKNPWKNKAAVTQNLTKFSDKYCISHVTSKSFICCALSGHLLKFLVIEIYFAEFRHCTFVGMSKIRQVLQLTIKTSEYVLLLLPKFPLMILQFDTIFHSNCSRQMIFIHNRQNQRTLVRLLWY